MNDNKKEILSNTVYEYKTNTLSGLFLKTQVEQNLKQMKSKGWELIEKEDNGSKISIKYKRLFVQQKPAGNKKATIIIILIVSIISIILIRSCVSEDSPKTPEQQIKALFDPFDGSHYGLKKTIKNSMNDPKSFEHVKTWYAIKKDKKGNIEHIIVLMTYRGKNAFGGVITKEVGATISPDGQIIKIIQE